jgi:antitoxin component YwqK of YwqJK toxin-antitoxin module
MYRLTKYSFPIQILLMIRSTFRQVLIAAANAEAWNACPVWLAAAPIHSGHRSKALNCPTRTSMNRFVPLLLALAGFSQNASAQRSDTLRRHDPGGWDFVQVRSGDRLVMEGRTLNGLREGVWTEYWDNKLPHFVTSYSKDQRNGVHLDIRKTGQVEHCENYSDGKLDGPSRHYVPGVGIAEEVYYSEGERSGAYTKWYPGGKVQEQSNFNHDKRDGKTTYFLANGVKVAEYNYNQGKLDGDVAIYSEKGSVKEFGRYENDAQTGPWKEYDAEGKLSAEGIYKKGEKTGPWKQYAPDGKVLKTVTYKNGKARD